MEQELIRLTGGISPTNTILVDTPFLIYHFEDILPYSDVTSKILDLAGGRSSKVFLSVISYTEVLVGVLNKKNKILEKTYKDFIINNPCIEILDYNYEIAGLAASIRSENGLGLADSVVIATAIKANVKVLITNDKDFQKIKNKNLKIILLDKLINTDKHDI